MLKVLRVVDLAGKNPGTRRMGMAICDMVLESKVPVVLDFIEVVSLNAIFLESLFGPLARRLNSEEIRKRVSWRNLIKEDELAIERIMADVWRQQDQE